MANTTQNGYALNVWKAIEWAHLPGSRVPTVVLPDGTVAEAMASIGYAWDGAAFQKMLVDSSGNLKVTAGTGYTPYLVDALTSVVTVSGSARRFGGLAGVINLNTTPAYLQCFDVASGTAVTLGTTVPTFVVGIPANATAANGVAVVAALDTGIALVNGLKIAATTTAKGASTVATGLSGTLYYGT